MDLQNSDDLGLRRPNAWVSVAGPLVEREAVKSKRRQDLMSGASGNPPRFNTPQGNVHLTVRRRDENARIPPRERASRQARQATIVSALQLQREPKDSSLHYTLPRESDFGCIEYKLKMSSPHPIRLQQLITQMQFRLSEGEGEAFYYLGVDDDGYPKGLDAPNLDASLATINAMATQLRAIATLVRCFPGAHGRRCALVHIQRGTQEEVCYTDLRVAVAGCVDSGKSTLVAVLTHGRNGEPDLDSGRGSARMAVLRHKHELESGRTSSLSQQLLGYDGEGCVLNYRGVSGKKEVCKEASKVLTFIDMGGHERCLKTALYGLTAMLPDYALLCVSAAAHGLGRVSREHLAVTVALGVPVAVVVTKVDTVDAEQLQAVVADIRALAAAALPSMVDASEPGGKPGCSTGSRGSSTGGAVEREVDMAEVCPVVANEQQAQAIAETLRRMHGAGHAQAGEGAATGEREHEQHQAGKLDPGESSGSAATQQEQGCNRVNAGAAAAALPILVPIFPISAVTGSGLGALHAFLRAAQPAPRHGAEQEPGSTSMSGVMALTPPKRPPLVRNQADTAHAEPSSAAAQQPLTQQLELHGCSDAHAATHFQVDGVYSVEGVGHVVSGTVVSGLVRVGMQLMVGPGADGSFVAVAVTGIQRAATPVRQVRAGQAATLALQLVGDAGDEPVAPWPPRAAMSSMYGPLQGTALAAQQRPVPAPVQQQGGAASGAQQGREGGGIGQGGRGSAGSVSPSASSTQLLPELSTDCPSGMSECEDAAGLGLAALALQGDSDGEREPLPRRCASAATGLANAGAAAATTPAAASSRLMAAVPAASAPISGSASTMALPAAADDVSPDLLALFSMDDDPAEPDAGGGDAQADGFGGLLRDSWAEGESSDFCSREPSRTGAATATNLPSTDVVASAPVHSHMCMPPKASTPQGVPAPKPPLPPHHHHAPAGAHSHGHVPGLHESSLTPPSATLLGTSPPLLSLLAGSPPSTRKGAVLLGLGMQPRASWAFQCVLVLLGGHWPARGLVSGRWPPMAGDGEEQEQPQTAGPEPGARGASSPQRGVQRSRSRAKLSEYTAVIHCGNIRQLARLELLQEVPEDLVAAGPVRSLHAPAAAPAPAGSSHGVSSADAGALQPLHLPRSLRAAAALLHAPVRGAGGERGSPKAADDADHERLGVDCGCIVMATFRFSHRPEWLRPGARLIVRDRNDGHVSGAGCIQRVMYDD